MLTILPGITNPTDVKKLSKPQLRQLAQEIRKKIITVVGHNGGHLSSNLGVVELTIALHRAFTSPQDAIIWDVGHQCYTHKLLTGRYADFDSLRTSGGLSGFPKKKESPHDFFDCGHSSTSISSALGLLVGRNLQHQNGKVIAVIGDGALTGGMAMEALSHAGQLSKNLVVILNDNQMSISKNTGSLSRHLSRLTMTSQYQAFRFTIDSFVDKIPYLNKPFTNFIFRLKRGVKGLFFKNNMFVDLGFEYVGPLNGHNIEELEKIFNRIKYIHRPVVVHIVTQKGRGYSPAENDPTTFHGIGPFCISDGKVEKFDTMSFTEVFANTMVRLGQEDEKIAAITAAMVKGTGLTTFAHRFPDRFFDVGIAEQHAVTFAGGLAAAGIKPVVAIYSTFMQRAVDQVIHDVALQKLPVIFALDRSGPVADDGETHQGLYDISIFRSVPNLAILAPASAVELDFCLRWALNEHTAAIIRYPKGTCPTEQDAFHLPFETGRGVLVTQAEDPRILFVGTGGMFPELLEASRLLFLKGVSNDIYNLRFIKPFDEQYFISLASRYEAVCLVEDGVRLGGIGLSLQSILNRGCPDCKTRVFGFPDMFFSQGKRREILEAAGLAPFQIATEMELLLSAKKSLLPSDPMVSRHEQI